MVGAAQSSTEGLYVLTALPQVEIATAPALAPTALVLVAIAQVLVVSPQALTAGPVDRAVRANDLSVFSNELSAPLPDGPPCFRGCPLGIWTRS